MPVQVQQDLPESLRSGMQRGDCKSKLHSAVIETTPICGFFHPCYGVLVLCGRAAFNCCNVSSVRSLFQFSLHHTACDSDLCSTNFRLWQEMVYEGPKKTRPQAERLDGHEQITGVSGGEILPHRIRTHQQKLLQPCVRLCLKCLVASESCANLGSGQDLDDLSLHSSSPIL